MSLCPCLTLQINSIKSMELGTLVSHRQICLLLPNPGAEVNKSATLLIECKQHEVQREEGRRAWMKNFKKVNLEFIVFFFQIFNINFLDIIN